ncbi:MAG: 50S ribosomal protein L24e [Candidatus Diapherotrites archaeon]|nr:50S ribosomal protein L24e [Candidatus Diapherotrites archaeon]
MKCDFCGKEISKGTGITFVRKEGTMTHFCSRKCEQNTLKLKRKKRRVPWTQEYHKEKKIRQGGQ